MKSLPVTIQEAGWVPQLVCTFLRLTAFEVRTVQRVLHNAVGGTCCAYIRVEVLRTTRKSLSGWPCYASYSPPPDALLLFRIYSLRAREGGGAKRSGRDTDHSSPSAVVKNEQSYTLTVRTGTAHKNSASGGHACRCSSTSYCEEGNRTSLRNTRTT